MIKAMVEGRCLISHKTFFQSYMASMQNRCLQKVDDTWIELNKLIPCIDSAVIDIG